MRLDQLEAEMGLCKKLQALSVDCHAFTGDTTVESRKAMVRRAVVANGVEGVTFTVKDGKRITVSQQFQAAYGESL